MNRENYYNYKDVALGWHRFYGGKIEILPKCIIRDANDFSIWYTPGVAETSIEIRNNPDKVYELTNKWNTVAIISDGSRTLGLGNTGPLSVLPILEGKSLLFKYLGGVDAFPIVLSEQDPNRIVEIIKSISPSFGGINLEDISTPKCFYILNRLKNELDIPVWHDDQLGTATATLAALFNALEIVGKDISDTKFAIIGAGAANITTINLLSYAGANPKNMYVVDSKGILHPNRKDLENKKDYNPYKWRLCLETNGERRIGGIAEAIVKTDVIIAASRPGPGIIKKEWIENMNSEPIVFALANPIPEIWPWEAKEAGARIVGTGRSDFPNQINNSLVFPSIFRGVFSVGARIINEDLCITAAKTLANFVKKKGLKDEYIIPRMADFDVYYDVSLAVALKAMELGIARRRISEEELCAEIRKLIHGAKEKIRTLIDHGLIRFPPEGGRCEDSTLRWNGKFGKRFSN